MRDPCHRRSEIQNSDHSVDVSRQSTGSWIYSHDDLHFTIEGRPIIYYNDPPSHLQTDEIRGDGTVHQN